MGDISHAASGQPRSAGAGGDSRGPLRLCFWREGFRSLTILPWRTSVQDAMGRAAFVDRAAMRPRRQEQRFADYDVQGVSERRSEGRSALGGQTRKSSSFAREIQPRACGRRRATVQVAGSTRAPAPPCTSACWPRAERGAAIVLISEDLDEILSLSDRIGVDDPGADCGRNSRGQPIGKRLAEPWWIMHDVLSATASID